MPGEPVQTIGSLPPPLETAVEQAAGRGYDPARCGFELSRNIVLAVREAKTLRPDLVVKYGCYLLHNHSKRLGNELWAMYEQVCVALLQCAILLSVLAGPSFTGVEGLVALLLRPAACPADSMQPDPARSQQTRATTTVV